MRGSVEAPPTSRILDYCRQAGPTEEYQALHAETDLICEIYSKVRGHTDVFLDVQMGPYQWCTFMRLSRPTLMLDMRVHGTSSCYRAEIVDGADGCAFLSESSKDVSQIVAGR
jgi:hypothetical protein